MLIVTSCDYLAVSNGGRISYRMQLEIEQYIEAKKEAS